MASRDPCLATDLWMRTAEDLQRAHEHMLLLSRTTAEERVVGFLLDMAARNPGEPEVDLPMTRRDIADYLGLAIETVSRTLRVSFVVPPYTVPVIGASISEAGPH